jgi:hypothetical protein
MRWRAVFGLLLEPPRPEFFLAADATNLAAKQIEATSRFPGQKSRVLRWGGALSIHVSSGSSSKASATTSVGLTASLVSSAFFWTAFDMACGSEIFWTALSERRGGLELRWAFLSPRMLSRSSRISSNKWEKAIPPWSRREMLD